MIECCLLASTSVALAFPLRKVPREFHDLQAFAFQGSQSRITVFREGYGNTKFGSRDSVGAFPFILLLTA
jgi:hypothetical protein